MSLIEHVQTSLRLIERAIAGKHRRRPESSANVIVLDDVSPRYMKLPPLQACDVNLGIALHSLMDSSDSDPMPQAPALSVIGA